jgi:putative transposase
LPAKVSQQILLNLHRNWLSFFESLKSFKSNPEKFKEKPKPPKYKHKINGRNLLIYTKQAITKLNILSKTNIKINTKQNIQEVRIINKRFGYFIEVIYERNELKVKKNDKKAAIDLGLNNLITITSNCANALIINGRILKSINQYCNKMLAKPLGEKRRAEVLKKHYFRVKNYLHQSTSCLIKYLLKNNITKVVIGYNEQWKESINKWSKVVKQNQKMIPFLDLVNILTYKLKLNGINVILTEESYTSQSSYFDNDLLPCYGDKNIPEFSGKRVKRGLYKTKDGFLLNADINGSLNIGRKVIHDYLVDRSLVARPLKVNPLKTKQFIFL